MSSGLFYDSFASVHEDQGEAAGGGSSYHVAGVLKVTWRICNDEAPAGCGKVAVGDVDGYSLLTLRPQTVGEVGQVDFRFTPHQASSFQRV